MSYAVVLPIHAGAMIAALLSLIAAEILLLVARHGPTRAIRTALLACRAADAFVGLGVVAGIALVILGHWSLLTPWLIASFALIATLMLVQRRFVRPWETQVRAVLAGDPSSATLEAPPAANAARLGRAAVILLFIAVAALMELKPPFA